MNKTIFTYSSALLLSCLLLFACQKQADPQPAPVTPIDEYGYVTIDITHVAGDALLALNNTWYLTENGDSLQVTLYKYYISNVKLERADGTIWTQPDSYYLVDESNSSSKKLVISNVPAGAYTKLHFMVGVDSARNVSGAQEGALDPVNGMYWTWGGYIMAKLEGISPQSTDTLSHIVEFHCGGYTGRYSSNRKFALSLPQSITVGDNHSPEVHLINDLLEWFKTPTTIRFADLSVAMEDIKTSPIATNYADMFRVDHVHNE